MSKQAGFARDGESLNLISKLPMIAHSFKAVKTLFLELSICSEAWCYHSPYLFVVIACPALVWHRINRFLAGAFGESGHGSSDQLHSAQQVVR
jgi:hypothetical protein